MILLDRRKLDVTIHPVSCQITNILKFGAYFLILWVIQDVINNFYGKLICTFPGIALQSRPIFQLLELVTIHPLITLVSKIIQYTPLHGYFNIWSFQVQPAWHIRVLGGWIGCNTFSGCYITSEVWSGMNGPKLFFYLMYWHGTFTSWKFQKFMKG